MRRGSVLPLVAISMTVLLIFTAFTIDIGHILTVFTELQRTVDAGALAGAQELNGDPEKEVIVYTKQNVAAQKTIDQNNIKVVIGNWDGVNRIFTPGDDGLRTSNAVLVDASLLKIPLFFGPIAGVDTTDIFKSAIALGGGGKCLGVWGLEDIHTYGGIVTDSFDSTIGAYGGTNINKNGDLCSNKDIVIEGSTSIFGDALHGKNFDLITLGSSFTLSGITGDHCCNVVPPVIDMTSAILTNDNVEIGNHSLDICKNGPWDGFYHLLLDGGCKSINVGDPMGSRRVYYMNSCSILGTSVCNVLGPVDIYIDGPIDLAGNSLVNNTQNPHNLRIFSTGKLVHFRGDSTFYGSIIAPNADVIFDGTTNFYGVILGKTLTISGDTSIHVDESLVIDLLDINPNSPVLVR